MYTHILWASPIAQLVNNLPAMQGPRFDSWSGRDRLPTSVFLGFPCGTAGKESVCNVGDLGSIHGSGRSPVEGKCYPLQCFGLEKSMDCRIHGVAKSQTWLSDFCFPIHKYCQKECGIAILSLVK